MTSEEVVSNADVVRAFYEARTERDEGLMKSLLADDVVWHEPGDFDYSGVHRGSQAVTALLLQLVAVTAGTFSLVPIGLIETRQYAAAVVHWAAERSGHRLDGHELAVYRIDDGRIVEAWFFPDVPDPSLHRVVFSFEDER